MKSFRISRTKEFMAALLTGDAFDDFLMEKATVMTYNTFSIDGRIQQAYFSDETQEMPSGTFSAWKSMKKIVLDLIRGKQTPLIVQLLLLLQPQSIASFLHVDEETAHSLDTNAGFVLRIDFRDGRLSLTSGVAIKVFTADKETEAAWDSAVAAHLEARGISYEAD